MASARRRVAASLLFVLLGALSGTATGTGSGSGGGSGSEVITDGSDGSGSSSSAGAASSAEGGHGMFDGCMASAGNEHDTAIVGDGLTSGDALFISRTSWKPVTGMPITETRFGPMLSNPGQQGYTTLTGDDGFPAFYEQHHMLLTQASKQVDGEKYDLELQVFGFKQKFTHTFFMDNMIGMSFFFKAEDGAPDSPLVQQFLDDVDGKIPTAVDFQRALGPALKGDFYTYTDDTLNGCDRNQWFVFKTPFRMSASQLDAFRRKYTGMQWLARSPEKEVSGEQVKLNDFDESEKAEYEFFVTRSEGRDRIELGAQLILLPVFGSIIIGAAVMASTFVTDKSSSSFGDASGPGLAPSGIGRAAGP